MPSRVGADAHLYEALMLAGELETYFCCCASEAGKAIHGHDRRRSSEHSPSEAQAGSGFRHVALEALHKDKLRKLTLLCAHWLAMVTRWKLDGHQEAQVALLVAFEDMVRRVKEQGGGMLAARPATPVSNQLGTIYQLCFLGEQELYTPSSGGSLPARRITFKLPDERS